MLMIPRFFAIIALAELAGLPPAIAQVRFEVASIHPSRPGTGPQDGRSVFRADRFDAEAYTVGDILDMLNGWQLHRVVGGPAWMKVWVPTVFSKNRDRLLEGDIAERFFEEVLKQAREADLLSDEHFSVDGTLIEAWASQKSFQRKDGENAPPSDDPGNPTVNFHGEKRSNATHESTTDPDARLARKSGGHEAKLAYCGNVLIENRNGLVVDTELLQCNGTAERDAAMLMAERIEGDDRVTLAGDKGYDTKDFVKEMRHLNVTPHVAQNERRPGGSAIDDRTTHHAGYKISQQKRKCIEEVFGWLETVGALRKTRHRGVFKVGWVFTFAAAAYNLVRMRNLLTPAVQQA
jgi:hypothetical protein